jgi:ketosteroid isomerase-like protein
MDRDIAVALLDQLHAAQNEFYGGGGDALLRHLLASGIAWTVPGNNSIFGVYRGTEAVFDYFRRRRDLAAGTFRMTRRDVLAGEGDRIAALTDGAATIDGMEHRWSTVGLYEVVDKRIAACWLLPLNPTQFDAIWTA